MTEYIFGNHLGQSITFDITQDVLAFLTADGSANDVTIESVSGGLKLTTTKGSVTLTGVSAGNLTTSKVTFTDGSKLIVGDNTTNADADALGDNITAATIGDAGSQVWGLGGADAVAADGKGDDMIFGNEGADQITGTNAGAGNDSIYGGQGADTLTFTNATKATLLYGNKGNDTIAGTAYNDTIYGGQDNDSITANGGNDSVQGNLGDDIFVDAASDGNDTIEGGAGADTFNGGSANGDDVLYGNAGNDSILASGNDTIYGGQDNDTVGVGGGAAAGDKFTIYGNLGNDSITGNGQAAAAAGDSLYGGAGNDTISGQGGKDVIDGGEGNDSIDGGADSDVITAGAGDDTVVGGTGDDVLNGAAGADVFNSNQTGGADQGADVFNGGDGNDTFNLTVTGSAATEALTIGDFATGDVVNLTYTGLDAKEIIVTGLGSSPTLVLDVNGSGAVNAGEDSLTLSSFTGQFTSTNFVINSGASVLLSAASTGSSLTGGTGDDQILGGAGADTLAGGTGNDKIEAGAGNDIYTYDAADAYAVVKGGTGTDTVTGVNGTETFGGNTASELEGFEHLIVTSTGATTLTFDAEYQASLDSGVTVVVNASGATGAITLATTGNITSNMSITGGTNADVLLAGAGNDTIYGGTSVGDTLTGGAGSDIFKFSTTDRVSSVTAFTGVDQITDANLNGIDKIAIEGFTISSVLNSGSALAVAFGADAAGNDNLNDMLADPTVTVGDNQALLVALTDAGTAPIDFDAGSAPGYYLVYGLGGSEYALYLGNTAPGTLDTSDFTTY